MTLVPRVFQSYYTSGSLILATLLGCDGNFSMTCEHQLMKNISDSLEMGVDRMAVEKYLNSIGVEFTYFDKRDMENARDKDKELYTAKIVASVELSQKNSKLVTTTELMTIGFNSDELTHSISCKQLYTGP